MKLPLSLSLQGLIDIFNKNIYVVEYDMYTLKHYLEREITDYKKYIKFSDKKYCKNLVYRNHTFEIYLICWKPNQKTNLHKHPENGCLMKILEGELKEERVYWGTIKEKICKKNNILFIKGKEEHIIENISDKNAISIHIYSPPRFYDSKI